VARTWGDRLYYYGEATMKHIGGEIGVNESRVYNCTRAIRRRRRARRREGRRGAVS
jgi:hypothetical protein